MITNKEIREKLTGGGCNCSGGCLHCGKYNKKVRQWFDNKQKTGGINKWIKCQTELKMNKNAPKRGRREWNKKYYESDKNKDSCFNDLYYRDYEGKIREITENMSQGELKKILQNPYNIILNCGQGSPSVAEQPIIRQPMMMVPPPPPMIERTLTLEEPKETPEEKTARQAEQRTRREQKQKEQEQEKKKIGPSLIDAVKEAALKRQARMQPEVVRESVVPVKGTGFFSPSVSLYQDLNDTRSCLSYDQRMKLKKGYYKTLDNPILTPSPRDEFYDTAAHIKLKMMGNINSYDFYQHTD